jgi:hypothetical protein
MLVLVGLQYLTLRFHEVMWGLRVLQQPLLLVQQQRVLLALVLL